MKRIIYRFLVFIIIVNIIFCILDKYIYFRNKDITNDDYDISLINSILEDKYIYRYTDAKNSDSIILLRHNETISAKKGKKRILFIGDSFVFGYSNSNPNTLFWQRLKYLLKKDGYNDVEIYAIGSPGFSFADEMQVLIKDNPYYDIIDPDLVIYCMVENDFENIAYDNGDAKLLYWFNETAYINDKFNNLVWRVIKKLYPSLYKRVTSNFARLASESDEFNEEYGDKYGYGYLYRKNKAFDDIKYQDSFINDGLIPFKELDADKFVFYLFDKDEYNDEFVNRVAPIFKKNNVKLYDFEENFKIDFKDYSFEELSIIGDGHPNELMNNYYAERLLSILKKDFKNIIGKKSKVKVNKLIINDTFPNNLYLNKIDNKNYSFVYPIGKLLKYPVDKEYVKLNLEFPFKVKSINISSNSDNIKNVSLWYNRYMGDNEYILVNTNDNMTFHINDEIYSLNIHIDFKFDKELNDRQIYLEFNF